MNHQEVRGLALDMFAASGEMDEAGAVSTRVHVPAGIDLPRHHMQWSRRMPPKVGALDRMFGARSLKAATTQNEILTANEVEDDLIAYLDGELDEDVAEYDTELYDMEP